MFYYLWYSTVGSSLKPSHILLFVAPCSMSSYIKNDICYITYGTPLLGPVWNRPIFYILLHLVPCLVTLRMIYVLLLMVLHCWVQLKPSHLLLFVAPCSMSSYTKNDICSITYGTPLLSPVWNLPIFYFLLHLVPCLVTLRMRYVLLLMVLHCWVQFETFPSSTFCCTLFHV